MKREEESKKEWIVGSLYVFGIVLLSLLIIITQTFIQYHWDVRMDSIKLFLGQKPATETDVAYLFLMQLSFAFAILLTLEIIRRDTRWKMVTGISLLLFALIAAVPLTITLLIVWPAMVAGTLYDILLLDEGPVMIMVNFLVVIGVHVTGVLLWFKVSRNLAFQ